MLGYLNGGHLFDMNALRVKDLSDGAMLGRRLAQEFLNFYRERVPGCKDIEQSLRHRLWACVRVAESFASTN